MPERELTDKERQFAKVAAAGATQAAAYAATYSAKGTTATQRANGHHIAKKAHVAAEIKRLRRLPAVDDYAGIKTKMIERLLEIAENDANSVAQHRAIVTLLQYAGKGAEQKTFKEPVSIEQLVSELIADAEPGPSLASPDAPGLISENNLVNTQPVKVNEPHVEAERRMPPGRPQVTQPVNSADGEANATAQAFRAMRDAEIRAQQESVRRSREEVRRLTEVYRQQQEAELSRTSESAKSEELVLDGAQDSSIDRYDCAAVPRAYLQASGPRPGYRLETIPGRFPAQYRWVRSSEGDGP